MDSVAASKWIKTAVRFNGKRIKLWHQPIAVFRYSSAGPRLPRIVVVRDPSGRRRDDCSFSPALPLTATQIPGFLSRRWPLEVCFREVKWFQALEDPRNQGAKAASRTASLAFLSYDLVLLWYARPGHRLAPQSTLDRLWYRQEVSVFFEDILRTLRHAAWQERTFSGPALGACAGEILQPFVGWSKGLA